MAPAGDAAKEQAFDPTEPQLLPAPDALPETDPDPGLLSSTRPCALMPHCRSRLGEVCAFCFVFSELCPLPCKKLPTLQTGGEAERRCTEVASVPQSLDHLSCPAQKSRNHPPRASTKNHVLLSTESIPLLLANMNFISRK